MSTFITSLGVFGIALLSTTSLFGQDRDVFTSDFDPVRKELVAWDAVRGEWLANSMVAMAKNQPIPDRNFPEDFTPAEMFRVLPQGTQSTVKNAVQSNATTARDSSARQQWSTVNMFVSRPTCKPVIGRTYGDPHLTSFDGANYSFQTVGEFTLVKSASQHMNVQVRQKNQGEDFSLNTAIAMNVNGDRVCLYAQDGPDGNRTTPLRVHGEPVYIEGKTYYLAHGGTISAAREDYIITWPTGEKVKVDIRGFNGFGTMNIAVEVFPCSDEFIGILGNANGRQSDDFDIGGPNGRSANMNLGVFGSNDAASQAMEKEYLAFLAKDFARSWRITPQESLFDYGFGQSTFAFTDESFPRVHHTIGDMDNNQRDRSRRECERQGLSGADLNACIYDNGFLNIPPTPKPSIPDRTTDVVLKPITRPEPNVNPGGTIRPIAREAASKENPTIANPNGNGAQPISTRPNTENGQVTRSPEQGGNTTTKPGTDTQKQPDYTPPVEEPRKPFRNREPKTPEVRDNNESPAPSKPSSGSTSPSNPAPSKPAPAPSRPTPAPSKPTPAPVPSKPAPAPSKPAPAPAPKAAPKVGRG